MKIAQIGLQLLKIPSVKGGAIEKRIVELSNELARNNEVHVYSVSNFEDPPTVINDVHYHYIKSNYRSILSEHFFYYEIFKKISKDFIEGKYDVIHLHASVLLSLFAKLKFKHNSKTLVTVDYPRVGPFLLKGFQVPIVSRLALDSVDMITFVSNYAKSVFVDYNSFYKGHIAVVPNGVNVNKYKRDDRVRARYRAQRNLSDKTVILFVGRICPQKGVDILIDAYSLLRRESNDYKLLLVGPSSGSFHKREATPWALSILHRLYSLGGSYLGSVSEKHLIELYNACDVLVLPTREWEMFGMVMPEAMACGALVIASHCGGIPEVLRGAKAGTTFQTGNPFQLAEKIKIYSRQTESLSPLACEYAKKYSWENVSNQFITCYEQLV